MSIGYSTIAIGVAGHAGKQPGAEYNLNGFTRADGVFGIFNSLGTIAFAYGGHNVVMEIQVSFSAGSFEACFSQTMLNVKPQIVKRLKLDAWRRIVATKSLAFAATCK